MPSQNPMDYLTRRKILRAPGGYGTFIPYSLRSHSRPIVPLPELLEVDTPLRRIVTEKAQDRKAYAKKTLMPAPFQQDVTE